MKFFGKRLFLPADTAALGKYCTGGYGRIGVYRVNKQRRYNFSKCVLNSKFSHFRQIQSGISFITSLYLFIELGLY